jgi:hypothetical protein
MGINVVEGNFIRMSDNYDEIKDIAKNLTGYLRISVKKSGGFEEGYVFLENGKKIGYYYNHGMDEKTGKIAEELINAMKDSDYVVDIYEYDDNKLRLMKDLFKEIFVKENDTPKPEKIEPVVGELSDNNKGNYQKIVLNIPKGKPLKFGVNGDYRDYLKGKVLLDAFKKKDGNYKRCYVIYNDGTPILAAYEDDNGVLFGKEAYSIIEDFLTDPDVVIDIYKYDESKINILKEYCPEMNLIEDKPSTDEDDEDDDDLEEFMESLLLNKQKDAEKAEEENLSKEELLKKLGIKLPDEDSIDNLINNVTAPSNEELSDLTRDIVEKIKKFLEREKDIDNFNMDVSVVFNNGYACEGKITIFPKRKLGFIKKNINEEFIKDKINMIIRENILDIEPRIILEVK